MEIRGVPVNAPHFPRLWMINTCLLGLWDNVTLQAQIGPGQIKAIHNTIS